jgi:hypothetical protein
MPATKLFITTLLLTALSSAGFAQENPHAPESEPTGIVLTTIDADIYTYVEMELDGEKVWFAAPASKYIPGEEVLVPSGGLPMKEFYSQTLDRTFDMVYFVGAITRLNPSEEELPPGHPPLGDAQSPTVAEIDFSDIERPDGGKTVAEIFQQQGSLAGTSVVVQGKAVKVSNNILGKNWVHLRDGSGEAGSDDLTVTTQETIAVGEAVTVRGTLNLNRDFGSGYKYDVLLEDAEVQP